MSSVVDQHRAQSPDHVAVAILTVSDTRTEATDTSGSRIAELAAAAGHRVLGRTIVPDSIEQIRGWVESCRDRGEAQVAIISGGTGISPRDLTWEAVEPTLTKLIPGFGELFRMLSYEEIGTATILSRAAAGLAGQLIVFALPGSRAGVELAMTRIILPELTHLVGQATKG